MMQGSQGLKTITGLSETKRSQSVVIIGVIIGVFMNWLALYLNVILGLLSVGISSFVVLLMVKVLLRDKATSENLTLVSVAYGATSSAEASVGLLFLIWLYNNARVYGLSFNPPSWLLPSHEVLSERVVITVEWIIPLLIHYFLMFIPGITGLILGAYLAPKFIHNDEEYPFPGTIQRVKTVEVLVTNQTSKVRLFKKFLAIGFVSAFITLFVPIIDLSNLDSGMIFGIMLGTIGITMFTLGVLINSPKITIPTGIASILTYTLIGPLLYTRSDFHSKVNQGIFSNDFFGLYSYLLQTKFLSFLIGFILSAALISPYVFSMIKRVYRRLRSKTTESLEENVTAEIQNNNPIAHPTPKSSEKTSQIFNKLKFQGIIGKKELLLFLMYTLSLIGSMFFVIYLDILPNTNYLLILLLLIWILFLGSLIQGFITVTTIAKSGTAVIPPFLFDNLPLFFVGARGITPYVATPKGEVGETINIVSTLKFGQQMKINPRHILPAYFAGYVTAALFTPIFTLFLWKALGIGTVDFPAPGFPISIALIGPFAAGAIDVFLNIVELIAGGFIALLFPTIGVSLAIGMFFPPHMAVCITLGGLVALILEKKKGKTWMDDRGKMAATAVQVGATLTVPILILMKLFF
ncbi:MAG: OPT/YSL family transporter [Candidatus Hodarchaeota archaeon]